MPLPRMTMRRWMTAVAIVGLLLGASIRYRRYKARIDDDRAANAVRECYGPVPILDPLTEDGSSSGLSGRVNE